MLRELLQHFNMRVLKWVIYVLILIIFYKIDKTKIDVKDIITNHIESLKKYGASKIYPSDLFLFFGLPLILAVILVNSIQLDDTKLGIIVTAFTIFIGLLFNILAILLAFDNQKYKDIDKEYIKQVLFNVCFSILISISVIVLSLLKFVECSNIIMKIIDFILLYFIVVFLLTLLMILKRLFNLLIKRINDINKL